MKLVASTLMLIAVTFVYGCNHTITRAKGFDSDQVTVPGNLEASGVVYEITPTNAFVRFDFVLPDNKEK